MGQSQVMSGEAQSRTGIVVPAAQQALAEAVAAAGTPVVVVLRNGRRRLPWGDDRGARSG